VHLRVLRDRRSRDGELRPRGSQQVFEFVDARCQAAAAQGAVVVDVRRFGRGRGRIDPTTLRAVPYERTSGWSSKASEAELKGVEVCRD